MFDHQIPDATSGGEKVLERRFGLAAMEHLQHRKVKDELA